MPPVIGGLYFVGGLGLFFCTAGVYYLGKFLNWRATRKEERWQ